jgi:hypothetical protein
MNTTYYHEIDTLIDDLKKERAVNKFDYFKHEARVNEQLLLKLKRGISPLKIESSFSNNQFVNRHNHTDIQHYMCNDVMRQRYTPPADYDGDSDENGQS